MKSKILFITEPWPTLNVKKDSSLAVMRIALAKNYQVDITSPEHLLILPSGAVSAKTQTLMSAGSTQGEKVSIDASFSLSALNEYAAVVMRKDPPFDMSYVSALWILRRAKQMGADIINHPEAILQHNEKLSILEFPELIPPTLIAANSAMVLDFLEHHQDIIVKPLNGMGGTGVFRLQIGDPNIHSILETLLRDPPIMVQRYLPEIAEGDKRVFILGGKVIPYVLARIPRAGETRGNLAAGGHAKAMPITTTEHKIAEKLAPVLYARGLTIVGLDIIGGSLTEINITSPTCMVEIEKGCGYDVALEAFIAIQTLIDKNI